MILVTGATGFVGSEILRRASRRGWRVRGLSRQPDRAGELGRLPHVELFRADIGDPPELAEAMEGVRAVIHLVGIIAPTGRQSYEEAHVVGTRNVLTAAVNGGVGRYVHMSALAAEQGRGLTEYWRTKWEAEEAVREAGSRGLSFTIFRPSTIFGAGDAFFSRLAGLVRWSPIVPLPDGGGQRMQPVWVGDVAECFLQAARMDATPRAAYDVAGPDVLTLREIVSLLAGVSGKRRRILPLPLFALRAGAAIAELLPSPPLTREMLDMLAVPSVVEPGAVRDLVRDFEIEHARLADKASDIIR